MDTCILLNLCKKVFQKLLKMIVKGDDGWEQMLPKGIAETIKAKKLFGYSKSKAKR